MSLEHDKWTQIGYITEDIAASTIVSLKANEMLCVSHNIADNYKFNMNHPTLDWNLFSTRPQSEYGWMEHHHLIGAFNKKQEKVYLYGGNRKMHIFDPKTKKWDTIPNVTIKDEEVIEHFIFSADDTIHLLGGDHNNSHQIWNNKTHKFQLVHEFTQYEWIRYGCCVYVPHKRIILLIGGLISYHETIGCIWKYSMRCGQWTVIPDIELDLWKVSAVVTDDSKHVIFTGNSIAHNSVDSSKKNMVYILDINDDTFTLRKSGIQCPKAKYGVLKKTGSMKDELLMSGYVRNIKVAVDIPPIDLLKVIREYYSIEMVHWIQYEVRCGSIFADSNTHDKYEHYMIPLRNIMSNTYTKSTRRRHLEDDVSGNNAPPSKKSKTIV